MSSISERIAKAIEISGKKKVDIAKELRVSQPFISQLCAGQRQPSNRTLLDLSDTLGVNLDWLRTGEGNMLALGNDAEMLSLWAVRHLSGDSNDFKRRFMRVITNLTDSEWGLLERKLTEMLEAQKNPPDGD